jgi:MoaA/NifB/PqqE/SkfB family radical SAM enzyme
VSAPRQVISWNIVGGCNYRCSYCVQKHAEGLGGPSDAALRAGLERLAQLPGRWEIKISGGEPFLLRRLPQIAARLAATGHTVSVLTNLSLPLPVVHRFVDAAGEALRTFSCSFHAEQVSETQFLERALSMRDSLLTLPRAGFVVNCVLRPGHILEAAATRRRFERARIKFYPQLMRHDGRVAAYSLIDRWHLRRHFGDFVRPSEMNRGVSLTGRRCHAGSRYFIITPKGDAFTCYPGKRFGDGRLGNVFDGSLRLKHAAMSCPYAVCPCSVPQNRGIVEAV